MRSLLVFLLFFSLTVPLKAQVTFSGTSTPFQDDLYAGVEDALDEHQGDIVILFHHPSDDRASQIAQCMLSAEESASYITGNFELIAVEIGSEEWKKLQFKYRPGAEADWPYVLVDVRRFLTHAEFHGWENCTLGDPLPRFQTLKEYGAILDNVNDD